ncbi:OPT superfamily oligopeptide transporter [Ceraceosorus guamensis]|uniref:OPT superfamily oligopeptide transporter n=1 Tax=Ceraceosorus guamensis TaxID=1522189 RepID=A0A316W5L3_9BASI|nr:OPT superfamily oligopeptide transporter [Ceraceosorus guamensis]PWN45157.1 OPT superfamily oligopeptide transporter [Ceraceosorus guamensis]
MVPDDVTPRALLGGIAVGSLLAFTNLYFGLQSSWITMASLQAALVGYGLVKLFPAPPTWLASRIGSSGSPLHSGPFSPQENAVLQATAVSAGAMPLAAGLIGIVPAFTLLDPARDGGASPFKFSLAELMLWSGSLAFFGVFFAAPLRVTFVLKEKLRFPSGTATAQLIGVIHNVKLRQDEEVASQEGGDPSARADESGEHRPLLWQVHAPVNSHEEPEDLGTSDTPNPAPVPGVDASPSTQAEEPQTSQEIEESWRPMWYSFLLSAGVTLLAYFIPVVYAVPAFDILSPAHDLAKVWGWWFTPSLSYVGQGVIMGFPTSAAMFAGAIVGWGILSPLAHHYGWAKGEPLDADTGSRAWLLWIALAIMTSESFVGILVLLFTWRGSEPQRVRAQARGARGVNGIGSSAHLTQSRKSDDEDEPAARLIPASWLLVGLVLSAGSAVTILIYLFGSQGVDFLHVALGILVAAVLAVLAVRSLGTVDLNPVGALGKLSQLVFAFVAPNHVLANLVGGALAEGSAMHAGELMQDFKTGHLVRASPRGQFVGQLVGGSVGLVVSSIGYKAYESSYAIPGPEMPAPAARLWLNFARLINDGEQLPARSKEFMIATAAVFATSGALKTVVSARQNAREHRRALQGRPRSPLRPRWETIVAWLPNGIAFAVGLGLNTPNYTLARLLGGLLSIWYQRRQAQKRGGKAPSPFDLPPVFLLVLSAGFVLGEGAASIVTLLLRQVGAQPWSCWGCRGGCSGICAG